MNIYENHNTSVGKYGEELTRLMEKIGISPKYLLSACRFRTENGVPIQTLALLFKQWNSYVMRNHPIDVNTLTYNEFRNVLNNYKMEYGIPNKLYADNKVSIGVLNNAKDVQKVPVKNDWCIKSQKWFDDYTSVGWRFFVIYLPQQPLPFTYVVAGVHDGNVEYYNTYDHQQYENMVKNVGNDEHSEFEKLLPAQVKEILYNVAAQQTEEKENNQEIKENRNMNKKTSIRLFERIAGEKGMNDAEVMRRRNDNFIKDMDSVPNSLWDNPYEPNYGDSVEMNGWFETPEETQLKVARDRLNRHRLTQNHITNNEEIKENRNMNKKQVIRINESQLRQIVMESVKRVLNEDKPPFLDSELATGDHERCANYRVTSVIREFTLKLRQAIIDDEYGDNIDKMFVPKVDQAIRKVLAEYGIPN